MGNARFAIILAATSLSACSAARAPEAQRAAALVAAIDSGSIAAVCPCTDITAATAADGHVEVFARAQSDGGLWRFWESGANGSYSGANVQRLTPAGYYIWLNGFLHWIPAESIERAPAAVLSHADGKIHVFHVRSSDGALLEQSGSGIGAWSSTAEYSHGGVFHDPSAVEISGSELEVVATGSDGQAHERHLAGGLWSSWNAVGALPGVSVAGRVAAVYSPRDPALYLVARDQNGATWVTSTPAPGSTWAAWNGLGGYMQFPAVADVDTGGALNVVGVGGDGQIWVNLQNEQDDNFGGWSPLVSGTIGAGNGANSAPVIAAYSDPQYASGTRRLEIFFTNNSGGNGVGSFWSWAQISPGTWTHAQSGITQTGGYWWAAANSAVAAEQDGRLTGFSLDHAGNLRYARAGKPVVSLPRGDVIGRYQGTASVYKAIPYAQPPVYVPPPGTSLRWAPPQPVIADWGARDAGFFANVCPQARQLGKGNEDCLYLNVFAPSGAAPGSTPVMVYIHGGSNYNGSALGYDAASLVNRAQQLGTPVVVVTIQYRLGVFGMLAYPGQSTGNFGYLDQIAALQWVHQNIASFGGDPARVTIFGESAGAHDTQILTASPLTHGQHLFWAAIMESGADAGYANTLADSLAAGSMLAQGLGCTQAPPNDWACLQGLSTTTLVNAANVQNGSQRIGIATTIDNSLVTADEDTMFAQNLEVPIIVGANREEMASQDPSSPDNPDVPLSSDAYTQYVQTWFAAGQYLNPAKPYDGSVVGSLLALYPPATNSVWQQIAIDSDPTLICGSRHAARIAVGTGQPVYRYLFTHAFADPNNILVDNVSPIGTLGAFHTAELPFVFGSLGALTPGADYYRATAAEQQLSDTIITYWTRFATFRNPNGGAAPPWPTYTSWSSSYDPYQQLDVTVQNVPGGYHVQQCDYWAQWE